jgi:hypothetical protein
VDGANTEVDGPGINLTVGVYVDIAGDVVYEEMVGGERKSLWSACTRALGLFSGRECVLGTLITKATSGKGAKFCTLCSRAKANKRSIEAETSLLG